MVAFKQRDHKIGDFFETIPSCWPKAEIDCPPGTLVTDFLQSGDDGIEVQDALAKGRMGTGFIIVQRVV